MMNARQGTYLLAIEETSVEGEKFTVGISEEDFGVFSAFTLHVQVALIDQRFHRCIQDSTFICRVITVRGGIGP